MSGSNEKGTGFVVTAPSLTPESKQLEQKQEERGDRNAESTRVLASDSPVRAAPERKTEAAEITDEINKITEVKILTRIFHKFS